MSTRTIQVTDQLYEYLVRVSVREPEILRRLRAETAKLAGAGMQISPEQGQFMALLIELMGARRSIEVGVFTGYSSLAVAQAMPEDGRIVACDVNADWTAIARRYWQEAGVSAKIELRLGPALASLDALIEAGQSGSYDFCFIDADKENSLSYYERALILLRSGGLVAVDNALWGGSVADDSIQDEDTLAIRELNQKAATDPRVSISLVPIGDGLLLARKR